MSAKSRPRTIIFWYTEYRCLGRPVTVPLMPASARSLLTCSSTSARYCARCGARWSTSRSISANIFGYKVANARSSSSHLMAFIPSRCANGA